MAVPTCTLVSTYCKLTIRYPYLVRVRGTVGTVLFFGWSQSCFMTRVCCLVFVGPLSNGHAQAVSPASPAST